MTVERDTVHVARYAYEDRYPPGTDLREAVYQDLRRYCRIFGLTFHYRDVWFFTGQRWTWWAHGEACNPTGVRGIRASVDAARMTADEAARRGRNPLVRPRPIPPGLGRRHWNDVLNGTTRRERRRRRRQRRKQRQRTSN